MIFSHIQRVELPDGGASHGLAPRHFRMTMRSFRSFPRSAVKCGRFLMTGHESVPARSGRSRTASRRGRTGASERKDRSLGAERPESRRKIPSGAAPGGGTRAALRCCQPHGGVWIQPRCGGAAASLAPPPFQTRAGGAGPLLQRQHLQRGEAGEQRRERLGGGVRDPAVSAAPHPSAGTMRAGWAKERGSGARRGGLRLTRFSAPATP